METARSCVDEHTWQMSYGTINDLVNRRSSARRADVLITTLCRMMRINRLQVLRGSEDATHVERPD